jgi:hypothetical protein
MVPFDTEQKIESLLCEDPAAFVQWRGRRDGDSVDVELWGTWGQFLEAVRAKAETTPGAWDEPRIISSTLDCSLVAASRGLAELRRVKP